MILARNEETEVVAETEWHSPNFEFWQIHGIIFREFTMWKQRLPLMVCGTIAVVSIALAQPPGRPGGPRGGRPSDPDSFVRRMMTFDANDDGKLSKDEITDTRLIALFERVDDDHDATVTKDELLAYYEKESTNSGGGEDDFGPGFGFGHGPGGPRGPGGPDGPGGFGGRGGRGPGGPPDIGIVLSPPAMDMLRLTNAQRKKVEALQKLVDAKLEQILTDEQKVHLEELRSRGPGGPGGPGRFGPPPDGGPGRRRGPPGDNGRPQRPPE